METDAEDLGIDAAWVQDSPDSTGSKAGDPTAVVLNSQHVYSLSLACSPLQNKVSCLHQTVANMQLCK